MTAIVLHAIYTRPATYATSDTEIDLTCDCHPQHWGGRGLRTGLHSDPTDPTIDRAVYTMQPTNHQELYGHLVMLLPDGSLVPV